MTLVRSWITRLASWLRFRSARSGARTSAVPSERPRDFMAERETGRTGQMSSEDQSWETETRERDRSAREAPGSDPES